MTTPKLDLAISRSRRRLGFDVQIGYLGKGDGDPRDPRTAGNLWVRFLMSDGLYSAAVSLPVDGNANIIILEGLPVDIGLNSSGQQCILRMDVEGLRLAGQSPLVLNPLDPTAHAVSPSTFLAPFYFCRSADPAFPLTVSVYPQPLLVEGTLQQAGADSIDLAALVPAAGLQCWAVVFWNASTQLLEAFASTPLDLGDVIEFSALQECIDQATAASISICGVYLSDDESTLDDNEAHWIDLRQWINVPGAGSDTTAIHTNVSGEIDALTEKVTPVSADELVIEDSAAAFSKKKVKISSLPTGSSGITSFDVAADSGTPATIGDGDTVTLAGTGGIVTSISGDTVTIDGSGISGGGMTSFSAAGDSGTPETISDGDTLTIEGGTGLSSVASATGTVTINLDVPVTPANGGTGADLSAATGVLQDVAGTIAATQSPALVAPTVSQNVQYAEWSESGTPSSDTLWQYAADDNGYTVQRLIDSSNSILQQGRDSLFIGKNVTGSTLNAGTAVYVFGASSGVPTLKAAVSNTAADTSTLAIGFTLDTVANNGFTRVQTSGVLAYDTHLFTAGHVLYLSTTPGALTQAYPQSNGWIQICAIALDSSASGHILITFQVSPSTVFASSNYWIGDFSEPVIIRFSGASSRTGSLSTPSGGMSASRAWEFPDAGGTLALTSDVPLTTKGDLFGFSTVNARVAVGANGTHLVADSAQTAGVKWQNAWPFAVIEEQQTQNTAGGGSTATTWTNRVLNTEVVDADAIVSISSNLFTPIAGTYRIRIESPFVGNAAANTGVRIRLWNNTASSEVIRSTNFWVPLIATNGAGVTAFLEYIFTANGTDAYAVQYYVTNAKTTNGLGSAINETSAVERYTRVTLEKIG